MFLCPHTLWLPAAWEHSETEQDIDTNTLTKRKEKKPTLFLLQVSDNLLLTQLLHNSVYTTWITGKHIDFNKCKNYLSTHTPNNFDRNGWADESQLFSDFVFFLKCWTKMTCMNISEATAANSKVNQTPCRSTLYLTAYFTMCGCFWAEWSAELMFYERVFVTLLSPCL